MRTLDSLVKLLNTHYKYQLNNTNDSLSIEPNYVVTNGEIDLAFSIMIKDKGHMIAGIDLIEGSANFEYAVKHMIEKMRCYSNFLKVGYIDTGHSWFEIHSGNYLGRFIEVFPSESELRALLT